VIRAIADSDQPFAEALWLDANVSLPRNATALVILAHHETKADSDGVRPKIAEHLAKHRLACCAVGLARGDEYFRGRLMVDVETLGDRLQAVVDYFANWHETSHLPVAVFGENQCASAALIVAANGPRSVHAVGAYCGRPDLASFVFPRIELPTLLIVPGRDRELLERNERTFRELACPSQIAVIGNATRSLRETGAAHACRYLIRRWCQHHAARRIMASGNAQRH